MVSRFRDGEPLMQMPKLGSRRKLRVVRSGGGGYAAKWK
jgi:hypothetical protein